MPCIRLRADGQPCKGRCPKGKKVCWRHDKEGGTKITIENKAVRGRVSKKKSSQKKSDSKSCRVDLGYI